MWRVLSVGCFYAADVTLAAYGVALGARLVIMAVCAIGGALLARPRGKESHHHA